MSTIAKGFSTDMGVRTFVIRHPLLATYILMFTIAWSVMIPDTLYSQGIISSPLPEILEIFTGWSPAIATLIVAVTVAGRSGMSEVFGRFLIWRVGFPWYMVGVFLLAGIILGGIGLHVLFGGAMPVIPIAGEPVWEVALTFLVGILVLFIGNTEEIVWRGIAVPKLQDRYGAVACVTKCLVEPAFR